MITENNKTFLAKFGSEKTLETLMNDEDSDVRSSIARHPNLKDHHIDKLMNDEDSDIRSIIAKHSLYKKMKEEGKI